MMQLLFIEDKMELQLSKLILTTQPLQRERKLLGQRRRWYH